MIMSNIPGDTRPAARGRHRSKAWVYYLIVAILGIAAAPSSHGSTLVVTALAGAYSLYIFRGGRIVVWFW
jgi:hypothetical protein